MPIGEEGKVGDKNHEVEEEVRSLRADNADLWEKLRRAHREMEDLRSQIESGEVKAKSGPEKGEIEETEKPISTEVVSEAAASSSMEERLRVCKEEMEREHETALRLVSRSLRLPSNISYKMETHTQTHEIQLKKLPWNNCHC